MPGPPEQSWTVRFRPLPALYAKANDAALLLRELARLGSVEVVLDATGLPGLAELEPEGAYLAWTVMLTTGEPETAIREVFDFVEGDCELDIQPVAAAMPPAPEPVAAVADEIDVMALIRQAQASVAEAAPQPVQPAPVAAEAPVKREEHGSSAAKPTIRVDLDRVDRLIDLVGELVINQAMLAQRVVESGVTRSSKVTLGLDDLEQLTREIQDSVMAIRAQPVKSVFSACRAWRARLRR